MPVVPTFEPPPQPGRGSGILVLGKKKRGRLHTKTSAGEGGALRFAAPTGGGGGIRQGGSVGRGRGGGKGDPLVGRDTAAAGHRSPRPDTGVWLLGRKTVP